MFLKPVVAICVVYKKHCFFSMLCFWEIKCFESIAHSYLDCFNFCFGFTHCVCQKKKEVSNHLDSSVSDCYNLVNTQNMSC